MYIKGQAPFNRTWLVATPRGLTAEYALTERTVCISLVTIVIKNPVRIMVKRKSAFQYIFMYVKLEMKTWGRGNCSISESYLSGSGNVFSKEGAFLHFWGRQGESWGWGAGADRQVCYV